MLDMGFEPQIRKILAKAVPSVCHVKLPECVRWQLVALYSIPIRIHVWSIGECQLPRKRHTLFFTATWPKEAAWPSFQVWNLPFKSFLFSKVRKLAAEILNRPDFRSHRLFMVILQSAHIQHGNERPYKVMIGNREVLKGNQETWNCRDTSNMSAICLVPLLLEHRNFPKDITQIVKVMDTFNKSREIVTTLREVSLASFFFVWTPWLRWVGLHVQLFIAFHFAGGLSTWRLLFEEWCTIESLVGCCLRSS